MTPKQEAAVLRELGRIYKNCAERVATYTRWRWITTVASWALLFLAALLSASKLAGSAVCLVVGLLGGFAGGISILFASAAKQMPLLVRYTTLREEELQKRLEELQNT